MVYLVDDDARKFEFWSGAKDTIEIIREYDETHNSDLEDQLYDYLDEVFSDESDPVSDTKVNDTVWFDVPEMDPWKAAFAE